MKLLIFPPYYPPHIGGLESYASELNKHISPYVTEIKVFTPRIPQNAPRRECQQENIYIFRFPAYEIIPNYPIPKIWCKDFWHLWKEIDAKNAQIVITHTRFFLTSFLSIVYARIKKIPSLHIEHGSNLVHLSNPFLSLIAKIYDLTFGIFTLCLAHKNIAISHAVATFVKKYTRKSSCDFIYRGFEQQTTPFTQQALQLKEKYPNETIIVYIGRLIHSKGVHDLLRAISDIKKPIVLFIVGDGPQKKHLEQLSERLHIREKIHFFGYKNHDEALAILSVSDIFVNPSYTEGLPTTVIEAALQSIPIIATNVGGTNEIISHHYSGIFVPPHKPILLSNSIQRLIENPAQQRTYAKKAYIDAQKRFSWNSAIRQYMDIFNHYHTSASHQRYDD